MDQQIQGNKMVLIQQKEPPYNFYYINYPTCSITAANAAFLQQVSQLQQAGAIRMETETFKKEAPKTTQQHVSLLQHQHLQAAQLQQLPNNSLKKLNKNDLRNNQMKVNTNCANQMQVNNNYANQMRWEAWYNLVKTSHMNNQNAMLRQQQHFLRQNQNFNNGMSHPKILAAMKRTKAARGAPITIGRSDGQDHTTYLSSNVIGKRKREDDDDDDEVVVIDMKPKKDDELTEIDLELRL